VISIELSPPYCVELETAEQPQVAAKKLEYRIDGGADFVQSDERREDDETNSVSDT
jgi:hypothetical protein